MPARKPSSANAAAPKRSAKQKSDPLQDFARRAMPQCLCMNLRIASRRLVNAYEAKLAAVGLGISQFGLLASIAAEPDDPMARLAERLEISPSTLTRTLRPLEEEGLIELYGDPENLRVRRVRLTLEGRARLMKASAAWTEAQAQAAAMISPKLVDTLLKATEKLPV